MKNKQKWIGSLVMVAIFIFFLGIGHFLSKPVKETPKEVFKDSPTVVNKEGKNITVYVNGEVKNPGVYSLKLDSRIEELIKIAGGFTDNADRAKLNLAKKLKDEDHILVESNSVKSQATGNSSIIKSDKVNINTATKEELKTVPGIGDVTAQKIIDYREKSGEFSNIEDLKKIGRMGDKTLEKIKDKIEAR